MGWDWDGIRVFGGIEHLTVLIKHHSDKLLKSREIQKWKYKYSDKQEPKVMSKVQSDQTLLSQFKEPTVIS